MNDLLLLAPAGDPAAILRGMCTAAIVPVIAFCIFAIAVLFGGPRK